MSWISQIVAIFIAFAARVIEAGGYPGLFLYMLVGAANIPLPSEPAYGFAGFLSFEGTFRLALVIAVGALGNIAGASINYWIGKRQHLRLDHQKRFFLIPHEKIDRAQEWFSKWSAWAVFLGHVTPGVRAVTGFLAGFFNLPYRTFLLLTAPATFVWATLWAFAGYKLGVEWERVSVYVRKFELVIVVLVVAGGVWWVRRHFFHKKP